MEEIKLSVIIVSYNTLDLLCDCLNSIAEFNDIGKNLEVIVSDNSPDYSVYNHIKKNYQWVNIIHNTVNKGFGYGNNRGEEIAKGRYLLFLNPDTVLIEPIFKKVVNIFESKNISCFGVKLIDACGNINHPYRKMDAFGFLNDISQRVYDKLGIFISKKMYTSGADLFIRRDLFNKIGKFDENMFMYFEESDILRRILEYDPKLVNAYFNDIKIVHLEGKTTPSNINSYIIKHRRFLDTFNYYCDKHNLNFNKYIKQEIRMCKIRSFKYKLFRQHDKLLYTLRIKKEYEYSLVGESDK